MEKTNVRQMLALLGASVMGGLVALGVFGMINQPHQPSPLVSQPLVGSYSVSAEAAGLDFTMAAARSVHSVVHVKTRAASSPSSFYDLLWGQQGAVVSSGSGVILSADGYIVTNNHVVESSNEIEVVLNDKRSFRAEVVGKDPSTDLALLKIEGEGLQPIEMGNSDALRVGEWVLAVGNPFNLTSTVTAGIVSAKGRNINLLQNQYAIESFIQTDAAVNPGNSGGALVSTDGRLVGINTAIASRSGSFSGYSFAIPTSIVEKVVNDLKEFGQVQRGLLGVNIREVDAPVAQELGLDKVEGVLVVSTVENGAAAEAGIKPNDVILKVNGAPVNSVAELQQAVSLHRPGQSVSLLLLRDEEPLELDVVLKNKHGNTDMVSMDSYMRMLGAEFEPVDPLELKRLRIPSGVKVATLSPGKLLRAGVREGYVITKVNNQLVATVEDIRVALENSSGGIYIEGIYPNGDSEYYAFGMQ